MIWCRSQLGLWNCDFLQYNLLLKSDLNKESREYVDIIDKKARFLHQLIDDFYDFSRIMSMDYPVNLESINIRELLKEVIRTSMTNK